MKRITVLLVLLASGWSVAHAELLSTNSAAKNQVLIIDSSSLPIATGKAKLIIGVLQRTNGIYSGDYQINGFPNFFENDMGRLTLVISDELLAELNQSKVATITGTATTNGKSGESQALTVMATPVDINHGTLKLGITVGGRKMIFEPVYHFAEKATAADLAQGNKTTLLPPGFLTAKPLP